MTNIEEDCKAICERDDLVHKRILLERERPLTQNEKDWFNLRLMRYDIMCGSRNYRRRCIAVLNRAAERLEQDMAAEELERVKRPLQT